MQPNDESRPADALLTAALVLAVQVAADLPALAGWWSDHQAVLRLLPENGRSAVIAAKDRRKAELSARS